jgi:hypothetical protein
MTQQDEVNPCQAAHAMLSAAVSLASELPEPAPNGYKAEPYREIILVLLQRKLSHKKIAGFLRNQGVSIHQTAISKYLRAHPPTDEELARASCTTASPEAAAHLPERKDRLFRRESYDCAAILEAGFGRETLPAGGHRRWNRLFLSQRRRPAVQDSPEAVRKARFRGNGLRALR